MILGQPKTREDLAPLTHDEIGELLKVADHVLASGQPLEIPAAVPCGHLSRIGATLDDYRSLLRRLVEKEQEIEEDQGQDPDGGHVHLAELREIISEAGAFLSKQRGSRLVVPGQAVG